MEQINTQENSLKLIKNTKGYNWEIKLHFNKDEKAPIEDLDKLNKLFQKKYGEKNE